MFSSVAFSTSTKQCEIFDLPEEILLTIFKYYLSTNERKNVKLVCKTWFKTCNIPLFLKDELLNCLGVYQTSDIYELLNESEREILNLKFQNVKFPDDNSSFWQHNGSKVKSIDFINCEFQNNTLTEIIIFCKNLVHLSFVYTSQYNRNVLPPIIGLDGVLRNEIIRENLCSLEIDFLDSLWLSNYIIYQLFLIFPNVKILKISCHAVDQNFEKVFLDLSEFNSRNNFTFSPILNYLMASINRIENLKLNFPYNEFSTNFLNGIFETLTAMTRLTELSISMRGTPQLEYVETFIHSKQLKSLEFFMKMDCSLENLLLLFLRSNPKLQLLKISFFNTIIVTNLFFHELISSSLKSLYVEDFISVEDPDTCASCFSIPNAVLRNVSLVTKRLNAAVIQTYFLQACPNLHHLRISYITHSDLQLIFKYQNKLKSLISYNYDEIGIVGDCQHSGNQLTNIEYLDLPARAGYTFFKSLSSDPILANLKYLYIDITYCCQGRLNHSDLFTLVDIMPFLEGLHVYHHLATVDFWLQLCTKLNRLRFLYLESQYGIKTMKFKSEDYQKLFSVCPSLRAMVHKSNYGQFSLSYYFDTLRKEAVLKEEDFFYSLCVPKVGEFTIKWLKF